MATNSIERLQDDPDSWQDYRDDIRLFEGASMDGLEDEEPYYSAEEVEEILGRTTGARCGGDLER